MKAIAEYFRDLAQDDRYFGAEPPTPDAEMLARIAEREIARRVEARFEKGNLVLRPSDDVESPQGDVAPHSSTDAALKAATAGAAATALAVAAQKAEAQDDLQADDINDITVSTSAAEATDTAPETVAQEEADQIEEVSIDLSDMDLSDATPADIEDIATGPDEAPSIRADDILGEDNDTSEDQSIDDLIAAQEAKTSQPAAAEIVEDEITAPAVTDSVADKLQRIRAVVAAKSQAKPEYIEDEHATSGPDGDGVTDNDAIDVDDSDTLDDNLFADTVAAIVADEHEAAEDDPILFDLSDDDDMDEDVAVATAAQDDDTQNELAALRAKIAELEALAVAAKQDTDTADPQVDDDGLGFAAQADMEEDGFSELDAVSEETQDNGIVAHEEDDEDDAEVPLVVTSDETAEKDDEDEAVSPAPLVARVATAKRADVEAALAKGTLEEYEDEDEDEYEDEPVAIATALPGLEDSTLTPEQEAELAQELADLHAEIEDDDDWNFDDDDEEDDDLTLSEEEEQAAHASVRKAVKLSSPARAMLTDTSIEEDGDSVDRLADKTDSEMEEPEGNRRRSAIAHLRAAVAATKADRILGFGKKTVDEEEPYREDLADAVRPRRPKVTEARSARPAPVRPAPLKLVAEQRIDVEAEADAPPVRPRRVTRSIEPVETADVMAGDDTGFADFAESQGAHTLPELLEAAAAYMSFVEGRDQFSRPQLMTKLLQAESEASSREERLRSFGQLLRDGKIEKKGGGRFAASDSIGFKPDARAAG
ncbi:hypothetical protein [Marivita sp. XM-24bin2]|nr:hypothetical protein [Marivita sp. XM-24bin2]